MLVNQTCRNLARYTTRTCCTISNFLRLRCVEFDFVHPLGLNIMIPRLEIPLLGVDLMLPGPARESTRLDHHTAR